MDRHLFNRRTLIPDLSAGLVLGTQSIPSGMANGLLAMVNSIYGLHGYRVGVLTRPFSRVPSSCRFRARAPWRAEK